MADKDRLLTRDRIAVKTGRVRIPSGTSAVAGRAGRAPHPSGEAQVDVVRGNDGTVESIVVRCPCGNVTTLQCRYAEGVPDVGRGPQAVPRQRKEIPNA